MNTECIMQWWYLPVYTITSWHLGDTEQCVIPVHVKDWTDNPNEFIPNVHNYLGVTVLHTVGVTRKLHISVATWKHCVGLQDGVQTHAHVLVVHRTLCTVGNLNLHAHRFQLCPFLLPEIKRLEFWFITYCFQNPKLQNTVPMASEQKHTSLGTIRILPARTHEHHPTGI